MTYLRYIYLRFVTIPPDVNLEQSVKTNKGSRNLGESHSGKSQTEPCSRDERANMRKRERRTCSNSRKESAISGRKLCSRQKARQSRIRESRNKKSPGKMRVKRLKKTKNSFGEKNPTTLRLRKTSLATRQIRQRTGKQKTEVQFTEFEKSRKVRKKKGRTGSRGSDSEDLFTELKKSGKGPRKKTKRKRCMKSTIRYKQMKK